MPEAFPTGRTAEETWRACLARTLGDLRRSCRGKGPISLPNLRRLFERRWRQAAAHCQPSLPSLEETRWAAEGGRRLSARYRRHQPFRRCWSKR